VSYMNYGTYLNQLGRSEEAIAQFDIALLKLRCISSIRIPHGVMPRADGSGAGTEYLPDPESHLPWPVQLSQNIGTCTSSKDIARCEAGALSGLGTAHFLLASKLTNGFTTGSITGQARDSLRTASQVLEKSLQGQTKDLRYCSQTKHMLAQVYHRSGRLLCDFCSTIRVGNCCATTIFRELSQNSDVPYDVAAVASLELAKLLIPTYNGDSADDISGSIIALKRALVLEDLRSSTNKVNKAEAFELLGSQLFRAELYSEDGMKRHKIQTAMLYLRKALELNPQSERVTTLLTQIQDAVIQRTG
jgi:tetratricopeptide (TPR) repeat protein